MEHDKDPYTMERFISEISSSKINRIWFWQTAMQKFGQAHVIDMVMSFIVHTTFPMNLKKELREELWMAISSTSV